MSSKYHCQPHYTLLDDELEALLNETDFVEVPQNFNNKIMQYIDEAPEIIAISNTLNDHFNSSLGVASSKSEWWQWVALIGGGVPAFLQLLAFIFSAWNISSLG